MSMAAREQRILLKAGFSIFETQVETKRAWNDLMKDEKKLTG